MTILGAMFSGISGLNSNGIAMEIVGNNIANINTPGFKGSRADFGDVLARTMSGEFNIGRGSQLESTTMVFSQGGLETTDSVTDMAIEGAGFFMVSKSAVSEVLYTRAGNFHLNDLGYLVNPQGYRVQGFQVGDDGTATGTAGDIRVSNQPLPPVPTGDGSNGTGVIINLNLSSDATVNPGGPAFDVNDAVNTSNFVSSITVYDSLGNGHEISMYYRRVSQTPSQWEWYAVVPADDATSGVDTIAASGTLDFTTDGALAAETIVTPPDFDFVGGGTQSQSIGFDFGESIAEGGTGFTGSTQFGEASALVYQTQDGYPASYLNAIEITEDGIIVGRYDNGESVNFGRVAIARFTAQEKLTQAGGNMFSESAQSGPAAVGVANEGGNGRVFANSLESSNVDMAAEFVKMITLQRGFQASSRSITTADDMMTELLNVTR